MSEEPIKDKNILYIMAKLEKFGHPKLPFAITKGNGFNEEWKAPGPWE